MRMWLSLEKKLVCLWMSMVCADVLRTIRRFLLALHTVDWNREVSSEDCKKLIVWAFVGGVLTWTILHIY